MRPKLLEIEGLQSFLRRQVIDFETLGENGLFGIFGPTGSGKSTILDAVTFALYGRVKRADRGTQGIINTNVSTASVSFTFELLKDGVRRVYRVDRTYQRKKGSENSCEPKIARLIEITPEGEIPLCDKASDVTRSVEELLGLSHDDFTRAVVLPQNSFQEFLLLDNSKKRDMLERIFYLEEYGKRLFEKLSRKMALQKSRIDRVEGELSAYSDASEEALAEAQKAVEAADSEKARVEREYKLLEFRYNEANEVWQLVSELDFIKDKEERQAGLDEEIKQKKLRLERALRAREVIDKITEVKEVSAKLENTEKKLKEVQEKLPRAYSELVRLRKDYEELNAETKEKQPELLEYKTRLAGALETANEIKAASDRIERQKLKNARLDERLKDKEDTVRKETEELKALGQELDGLRKEIAALRVDPGYRQRIQKGEKLEAEVESLKADLKELEQKTESLKGKIEALEQERIQVGIDIESLQRALESLENENRRLMDSSPEDKVNVLKQREKLQALYGALNVLSLKKAELEETCLTLENEKANLKESEEMLNIAKIRMEEAQARYEKLKNEAERLAAEMNRNTAYLLAKDLAEGEPCPVCGSKTHPSPASRVSEEEMRMLGEMIKSVQKQSADAEKELRKSERDFFTATEKVKSLSIQIEQKEQQLKLKKEEYESFKQNLPEEIRGMEPEQAGSELRKSEEISRQKLEAVEAFEKKREDLNRETERVNRQLSEKRISENGIVSELKVIRDNLDQNVKMLENAKKEYNEKHQKYMEFLRSLNIESARAELERITDSDIKTNALQAEAERVQTLSREKEALVERLKEELALLKSESTKADADLQALIMQKEEKTAKLKELAGDADIEEEIRIIDEKLNEYVKMQERLQEDLKTAEALYNELSAEKNLLENQRKIFMDSARREGGKLAAMLEDRGFKDDADAENAILHEEEIKMLNEEISEYEREQRNIKAQKDILLKRLGSRSITEEEWNNIKSSYQKAAALREECISRFEAAKSSFNLIKSKHEKWAELAGHYEELAREYGLLEQIQKLLRAERGKDNSFIDYIAEERLRYIAARASETLGNITKYRYAIELDTEAGFIIRDNANGGVHRMVTSLSGGEIFLTSLSLALALSEQIQLKGQSPLEFFFLDEGFGTLDKALLDTVIDSLERLGGKERVIGIISHVSELKERITRRLIVEPPSSSGEGSRVVIEKA